MLKLAPEQNNEITVSASRTLTEILRDLGDPEAVTLRALRHHLLDQCLQRLGQARQQIRHYEAIYGMDYDAFNHKIGTDEDFLDQINQSYPLWEADAVEWVYRIEEEATWQKRSERLLSEL